MKNIFLVITIILLSGCSPVDKRIDLFNQLQTQIDVGNIAWVEENAKDIFVLENPDSEERLYGWGDDWWEIMEFRWDFAENVALIYFGSSDELVKKSAIEALQHFPTFYSEDARYPNSKQRIIDPRGVFNNWEKLSLIQQTEIFTALAKESPSINYDLDDASFIRDELCRAVGINKIGYVAVLISRANFDIGLVRCYDTGAFFGAEKYAAYTGRQSCPMSLRRVSGINAGAKINSRNQQWLNNLSKSNFDDMDYDVKKIKTAFQKSFKNLPDLTGVNSMNDLLDKYNKWNVGGNCTTRDLLKSGVTLPKGW